MNVVRFSFHFLVSNNLIANWLWNMDHKKIPLVWKNTRLKRWKNLKYLRLSFYFAAHPHAYFDNSNSVSEAKRSRMHLAEQQHKLRQQQLFQHQMQLSLGHHYQHQQSYYRPDLRISSFQQITPPESLAFWQQQQQQQQQQQMQAAAAASMCRTAGCTGHPAVSGYTKYSPPVHPPLCYPMPPTPMMTVGGRAAPPPFCLGCAQCARTGKCQQVNKENTLGIMRSLWMDFSSSNSIL